MKIGFIGAGKVGTSMGKYLTERGIMINGYYSKTVRSAEEAADFTHTRVYRTISSLAEDSDAVFVTVPDSVIGEVWDQLKILPIKNKLISHFSGSLSSEIFSDIDRCGAYGYSIHPLFAFPDRYNSYKELSQAFITIEGHEKYRKKLSDMFESFGNRTSIIETKNKIRYHAAAAIASNLYVGLVDMSQQLLEQCGFVPEDAHRALASLIMGNTEHIVRDGTVSALTGPVERNDVSTVKAHLEALSGREREVYRLLSGRLVSIAEKKHRDRDHTVLEGLLGQ